MSLTWEEQMTAVAEAIERFPAEFGLRNFPGKKFCIVQSASYFADEPVLYTYVWNEDEHNWLSFAKGTEKELRREIVALES